MFIFYSLKSQVYINNQIVKKVLAISLIAILSINPSTIYANDNYIDEDSLFDDIETVVSATRLKQKITNAPVSVSIIDREMIEASGALEVYELLRFVPGYFSYAVDGNRYGVTSHFGANDTPSRLEVRIDGRSVHQPLFDTVDWATLGIDVLDIDHIEVIRGTSAPVFGSNAFLGAINIVTKGSLLQKHQTTIRATVGSRDTTNLALNHAGNVSDVEYFLSLNAKRNTGFNAFTKGANNPVDKNIDTRESINFKLQGTYTPNVESRFMFDVGIGTNDSEIPLREDPRGFSNRVTKTNHQYFKWIRGSSKNLSTFSFYHNYLQIRDNATVGLLSGLLGVQSEQVPLIFPGQEDGEVIVDRNKGFAERIDFEYEKQIAPSEKLNLVFGVGVRKDIVRSTYLIGNDTESQNIFRVFSNADYKASDKVNINLGFLTEKTDSRSPVTSPRVAVNYQLNDSQTFRASVAKGLHAPSLVINKANVGFRFPDGSLTNLLLTNPTGIEPEKIKSLELAYIHRWPETDTQLDVKFFHEKIDDIFNSRSSIAFPDIDQSVLIYQNNGFIKNKGLELQLQHKFKSIPDLDMRLAYAYIDSEVGSQIEDTVFRLRNSIPQHSATLMVNKQLKNGYRLGTILQYQSDYDNSDEGIKRVDFNIGKTVKLSNSKTAKLDLSIQNAFNHYNDFSIRNDQDMRGYLRMQIDF